MFLLHRIAIAVFQLSYRIGLLFPLTLSWWRPLPYRNQSTDLGSKSMNWFLYDNGLHHERVKLLNYLTWILYWIAVKNSNSENQSYCLWRHRSNRPEVFCTKGVLENFANHLRQSIFLNKVASRAQACKFIKKETLAQVFSCKFLQKCF